MIKDTLGVLRTLNLQGGLGSYYSLPALEELDVAVVSRFPCSIRVVLESLLRNCDELKCNTTAMAVFCHMSFVSS